MIDNDENVLKTFSDYSDEVPVQYIELTISAGHPWLEKPIREISFPPDTLLVLILRNTEQIIPRGKTMILKGDKLILSAPALNDADVKINLAELRIDKNSQLKGKRISDLKHDPKRLIIMVKRGGKVIIPHGTTVLKEKDVLVINSEG